MVVSGWVRRHGRGTSERSTDRLSRYHWGDLSPGGGYAAHRQRSSVEPHQTESGARCVQLAQNAEDSRGWRRSAHSQLSSSHRYMGSMTIDGQPHGSSRCGSVARCRQRFWFECRSSTRRSIEACSVSMRPTRECIGQRPGGRPVAWQRPPTRWQASSVTPSSSPLRRGRVTGTESDGAGFMGCARLSDSTTRRPNARRVRCG